MIVSARSVIIYFLIIIGSSVNFLKFIFSYIPCTYLNDDISVVSETAALAINSAEDSSLTQSF